MTINNEFDYLIHLIKCVVKGEHPVEMPSDLSFDVVFKIGKMHEVANIAYLGVLMLNNKPSDTLLDEWKQYYYLSVQRDENQQKAHKIIVDKLHNAGIRTLEVQGTVIKPLYPSSDMRMMSDIDIIVDECNFNKAEQVLNQMGFETFVPTVGEMTAKLKNIVVEIHLQFFVAEENGGKKRYYDAMHGTFDKAIQIDNSLSYQLDSTNLYLYCLLHLLKHYEYSGCGVRRIVDFYYLNQLDGVDFEYINSIIKSAGLNKKADELMSLYDLWFNNIEPKINIDEPYKKVLTAGNHGNKEQFYNNIIDEGKRHNKHYSKYNLVLEFFFPSKKAVYDAYPFCKEHNYPLFLCWVHRFFASIFNLAKIKGAFSKLKRYNMIDK